MPESLTIHDWEEWQPAATKRGQGPWIKIHRIVLRHEKIISLSDAQFGQLVGMWLLAADNGGRIKAPRSGQTLASYIRLACSMTEEPDLEFFESMGLIERQRDDKVSTPRKQPVDPEKRSAGASQEIFEHWNRRSKKNGGFLVNHQVFSDLARGKVNARIREGRKLEDLKMAIDRFDWMTQRGRAPGHNQWGLVEFMGRHGGEWIDKMLDPHYDGIPKKGVRPGAMIGAQVEPDPLVPLPEGTLEPPGSEPRGPLSREEADRKLEEAKVFERHMTAENYQNILSDIEGRVEE